MNVLLAPEATKLITGKELFAMGDIGRCELIDGRIVPMSPTGIHHAYIEFNLGRILGNFVMERKLGWVGGGEAGIYIHRNPDRVRGADVIFLSREKFPQGIPEDGFLEIAPDLIVEVMSPNDTWQEVREKIGEYFSVASTWVWIVEPDNRAVLVYRSPASFTEYVEGDVLRGEGVLEGFEISVSAIFEK
jgi:Uma2 family endonuclease